MANTGLVKGDSQNNQDVNVSHSHSKFDLSRHIFGTYRFGENAPIFAMEVVPKDKVQVRSRHNIRSYTLEAPLMQNVEMRKDSFAVPMEAILPINWDKIYTNPVIGDDVDTSNVGTTVNQFIKHVVVIFERGINNLRTLPTTETDATLHFENSLKWLVLAEMFFSNGSLAASLGYRFADLGRMQMCTNDQREDETIVSFDKYFDRVILNLSNLVSHFRVNIGTSSYVIDVGTSNTTGNYTKMTLRELIEIMRDDVNQVEFVSVTRKANVSLQDVDYLMVLDGGSTQLNPYAKCRFEFSAQVLPDIPINLARLWAYQLINAHYYSNDHVDYIYSAELYRQNISSVIHDLGYDSDTFAYNGILTHYDWLSAYYTIAVLQDYNFNDVGFAAYFQLLMAFRHSLRYVDYFVGARVTPLAIGDVSANVSNGKVSAIDTTRSIQMQRFLNAVNRSGRKFSNYIKELFGVQPAQDYHNPIYIGHTKDDIYTVETENTGEAQMELQNSITANFRANLERFILEYFADRPAIVMTIMSFDVARCYTKAMERHLFHRDRYDMFNPMLQFLGDQRVYEAEFDPLASGLLELQNTFGYQNRYEEYKQAFNVAFGGFVENLPAWAYLADRFDGVAGQEKHISPSFIRSKACEFDKFYKSLTGRSLASYFHFIIDTFNMNEASRPMAYNPNILQ